MPYCTQSDIESLLPAGDLIALTDDTGAGVVTASVLDRAISDGQATIDAHCAGRYPLPLSPVPDKIRQVCVDLAIYTLFSRRSIDEMPKVRESRKNDAIRFLEKVASGGILLGATLPEPETSGLDVAVNSQERIFTRETLAGY